MTESPDTAEVPAPPARTADWWREAVIYQVYPRSFADANGDGMGDLPGIRSRLPYLRDLGVDAVWLSPFYSSPQADAGYDVADYRVVDPMFGTLDDAVGLIADAHHYGLRIIVDLVPNHCSDQHEWFQRALSEGPGSRLRERFHFRDGKGEHGEVPPNDWESIFGGPAWTRTKNSDGTPGQWYLHLFAPEQPDFNWDHAAVRDEFATILRFWLDLDVDGFRIDVAHGMVKAAGLPDLGSLEQTKLLGNNATPSFDQDGVHEIYRSWHTILEEYDGQRIGVAEAWAPTLARTANYVRADELHQAFNFAYLATSWQANDLLSVIDDTLDAMRPVGAPATWVLSNHDVTRHTTRFANPPGLGTQIRTPGDPELGLQRARAASLLMLALPGSAYVYQGEELGLPDVTDLPDEVRQDPAYFRAAGQDGYRDGCRVPIPWTTTGPSYGFGTGGSWLPQPEAWASLSVEAQTGQAGSTLEMYRSALAVRSAHPALGAADNLRWCDSAQDVLVFERALDGGPVFTCTVNLTGAPITLTPPGRLLLASASVSLGPDHVVLPSDATAWWTTG
ncbi:glycoside hydrolase family 13 protein [Streptomyces sp. NPDC102282]|uniref:glycoside hydrolase family 13 protein n=1 Tax=Streptomyces sp. NPDC102282 TaxID=3366154 RepID=UPI0038138DA3